MSDIPVQVRRSFLVRQVQTYLVYVPEGMLSAYDDEEDYGELDQYACDNGDLLNESFDLLDYDELETEVIARGEAAIPTGLTAKAYDYAEVAWKGRKVYEDD